MQNTIRLHVNITFLLKPALYIPIVSRDMATVILYIYFVTYFN